MQGTNNVEKRENLILSKEEVSYVYPFCYLIFVSLYMVSIEEGHNGT